MPSTCLRAAFPGGSITGAPKVRAMEIIAELEPSRARRLLRVDRLLERHRRARHAASPSARRSRCDGRVYFSAGGGIVADSDPEQEYRETLDKARGMIDALVNAGSP